MLVKSYARIQTIRKQSDLVFISLNDGSSAKNLQGIISYDFFKDDNKILLVDAGHFETEFFIKNKLQEILNEKIPNFAFVQSNINTNPVKYF